MQTETSLKKGVVVMLSYGIPLIASTIILKGYSTTLAQNTVNILSFTMIASILLFLRNIKGGKKI